MSNELDFLKNRVLTLENQVQNLICDINDLYDKLQETKNDDNLEKALRAVSEDLKNRQEYMSYISQSYKRCEDVLAQLGIDSFKIKTLCWCSDRKRIVSFLNNRPMVEQQFPLRKQFYPILTEMINFTLMKIKAKNNEQ